MGCLVIKTFVILHPVQIPFWCSIIVDKLWGFFYDLIFLLKYVGKIIVHVFLVLQNKTNRKQREGAQHFIDFIKEIGFEIHM